MPDWFRHVEVACERLKIEPSYVFAADPRDTQTIDIIEAASEFYDREVHVTWIEETPDTPEVRTWNAERYHRMVHLRNELLHKVRELQPESFLSLDSDIFLNADALVMMREGFDRFAAVGGKAYMTPDGTNFPSWMNFRNGGMERYDHESGPVEVDVIMAIKWMSPAAYAVDYQFNEQGEDIGWSIACKAQGLHLAWDGRVPNKHVMSSDMTARIDVRCGF